MGILIKNTNAFFHEGELDPLLELGLNKYEASIYLTLVTEGEQSAKDISNMTGVPYGKIYEMIDSLTTKGFVYVLPSKPMKVRAVSPREAIEHAKKGIHTRLQKLEAHALEHLEPRFREKSETMDLRTAFLLMRGRSNVARKVDESIDKAKETINILTTENGLKRLVAHKEILEKASNRGVDIRVSAPLTQDNEEDIKALKFCKFSHSMHTTMSMLSFDRKHVILIDASPDNENHICGRDTAILALNPVFTEFIDRFYDALM